MTANDFAYFSKALKLPKPDVRAKAFVSAHRTFQLFVSGGKVGGWRSPAPDIASRTGRGGESLHCRRREQRLARAIRIRLFDAACGLYRDSAGSERRHRGVNALAFLRGLIPERNRESSTIRLSPAAYPLIGAGFATCSPRRPRFSRIGTAASPHPWRRNSGFR